jgi:putative N-acetylmannosamine-6-phosphate epimerase
MIRTLGAKIDGMTLSFDQLNRTLGGYVTQERYEAEMRLAEHKHEQLARQVAEGKARVARAVNLALSAFVAPVIVGLVMWFLLGSK